MNFLYSPTNRGDTTTLSERARQFLLRVDALPRDHDATNTCAEIRAVREAKGERLAPLDMMITTLAVATETTLVTRDKTFVRAPLPLQIKDWAKPD